MQDTSFETLESLANFTITQLQKRLLYQMPGSRVHLRLEKPRAIPFADCPAVEILREMPGTKRAIRPATGMGARATAERPSTVMTMHSDSEAPPKPTQLNVIKPYAG